MTDSRYSRETTTGELLNGVDLSRRRILITGAAAGLGAESARALAAHGASVIMAVRDPAKGERAADSVRAAAAPNASVELLELDLASLSSVRACADKLLAEGAPLHILIANAGVMGCPQGATEDGFETQFGHEPSRPLRVRQPPCPPPRRRRTQPGRRAVLVGPPILRRRP